MIQDPAVLAVMPSQSIFHREGFSGLERLRIDCQTMVVVLRMHPLHPAVAQLLLHRAAREIEPWLIEKSAEFVRSRHPDQDGCRICEDTKPFFTDSQRLL